MRVCLMGIALYLEYEGVPCYQCWTLCLPCVAFVPGGCASEVFRISIFSERPCALTIVCGAIAVPRRRLGSALRAIMRFVATTFMANVQRTVHAYVSELLGD